VKNPFNMTKRRFICLAGGTIIAAGAGAYSLSDKRNLTRSDLPESDSENAGLRQDESEILFLASLAAPALAQDLGVRVGEFDSIETGPETAQQPGYYVTVMRRNGKALVEAFGG